MGLGSRTETIAEAAERILETLGNGNRNDAHAELVSMPTARALAVAAYMVDSAPGRARILRFFEDRAGA